MGYSIKDRKHNTRKPNGQTKSRNLANAWCSSRRILKRLNILNGYIKCSRKSNGRELKL